MEELYLYEHSLSYSTVIFLYHMNCGVIRGFLALRKAVTTQVKNVFFHVCSYSQSAADTALACGTTRSG